MPLLAPRHKPLALLVVGFVLAREVGFFVLTYPTDANIYHEYAAAARDDSLAGLFRGRTVEYPPAAVVFLRAALAVSDALPKQAAQWASFREGGAFADPDQMRFQVALGLCLFLADAATLALVISLSRRLYPEEGDRGPALRGAVYVVATTLLAPILYDRLDLVVGLAAVAAVEEFRCRRMVFAYALLAAGTAIKVVPVLLVPVFVLTAAARAPGRFLPAVLKQTAIAAAVLMLAPLVTYSLAGADGFRFLSYHTARGAEIETVYGWVSAVADPDARVAFAFGSHNTTGAVAERAAAIAPWALLAGLAAMYAALARGFARDRGDPTPRLVAGCVGVWLSYLLLNKVGSPQYLLWLAPLVALLPRGAGWGRVWVGVFLGLCLLAMLIYRVYYVRHVCGWMVTWEPRVHAGPTPFGITLLAARTACLILLLASLLRRLTAAPLPRP